MPEMNTDAVECEERRPLITYVLLGFNQERYIRKAIQSAFDQSYEPMEIVLSDDCSTDNTFDIMVEMADAYPGPNKVRVVQNPTNLGATRHILARGREAKSDIVVIGQGDDVSVPDRAAKVATAFRGGAACVHSLVSIIDENGKVLVPVASRPLRLSKLELLLWDYDDCDIIQGSSAAYRREVFDVPIVPKNRDTTEDFYFAHYLKMIGRPIVRIDEPLVLYRSHPDSASNYPASASQLAGEKRSAAAANRVLDTLDALEDLAAHLNKGELLNGTSIDTIRLEMSAKADWSDLSFAGRVKRILAIPTGGISGPKLRVLVWCLLRLWGRNPGYQPKLFISRFQKSGPSSVG